MMAKPEFEPETLTVDLYVDARDCACPLPLLKAKQGLHQLQSGQILHIVATDPGSWRDIPAFCKIAGHKIVRSETLADQFCYWLQKR